MILTKLYCDIKVFDFYGRGEFPSAKELFFKMNEAVGFEGGEASMLRIFTYARCSDGRKVLAERRDVAVRSVFLRTVHEIRQEVIVNCTT
jgi:hypothetical protein